MRRLLAALFAVLLLVGCGIGGRSERVPPAETAAPTSRPQTAVLGVEAAPGWTRIEVASPHFEMALPPAWRKIDLDEKSLMAGYNEVADQNPALGEVISPEAMGALVAQGVRLFAFDFDPWQSTAGFRANLNVIQQPMTSEASLDVIAQMSVAQIETALKTTAARRAVRISGLPAEELRYEYLLRGPLAEVEVLVLQYVVVRGTNLLTVTFSAPAASASLHIEHFERSGASFRFLD